MQTILIIDDDAAIGDLEQEVLERAGYAVHARPGSPAERPRRTRSPPAGRWATPPDTADGRCPYRRAASPPARRCGVGWSAPPGRASCTRGGTRSAAAAGPASPVTAPRWSAPGGFQCGGPARHAASPSAGSAAAVRTSVLHIKRKAPSDRMSPLFSSRLTASLTNAAVPRTQIAKRNTILSDGVSFCDRPQVLLPVPPHIARKRVGEGETFASFPTRVSAPALSGRYLNAVRMDYSCEISLKSREFFCFAHNP